MTVHIAVAALLSTLAYLVLAALDRPAAEVASVVYVPLLVAFVTARMVRDART